MSDSLIDRFDCDRARLERLLGETLSGADDGELFLESSENESLVFDNGRLKSGTYSSGNGFGLRSVAGEVTGYAHAGDLSLAALTRAADAVRAVASGHGGSYGEPPVPTNARRYGDHNPLLEPTFEAKAALLAEIDAHARSLDPEIRQVSAVAGNLVADSGNPARRRTSGARCAPAGAAERVGGRRARRPAGNGLVRRWRAARTGPADRQSDMAGMRRRSRAAGQGQSGSRPRSRRNFRRGARPRLARRHAARSGRSRPGGRLQPQEDLRLRRSDGRTGGLERRDRRGRCNHRRAARLHHSRRRGHAGREHGADRGRQARRLHAGPSERAADGRGGHGQRPSPVLRPPAHAAHDEHLYAGRQTTNQTKFLPA